MIGNVQAENAKWVSVRRGSRVGGSVQVKQGGGAVVRTARSTAASSWNRTARPASAEQRRWSDVQAFQNRGGVEIEDNRIDGNLQCKSNSPAPTGGGNTVQGNKEDQCRRL